MSEYTPLVKGGLKSPSDGGAEVRVGVDSQTVTNQKRWRRLADIDDSDCTARAMVQETFMPAYLRLQPTRLAEAAVDKYQVASMFITDGIHGRKLGYRLEPRSLVLQRIYHTPTFRSAYTLLVLLVSSFALFESESSSSSLLLSLETLCLLLFAADVYIRWFISSNETKRQFLSRQPWAYVRGLMLMLMFIDIILFFFFFSSSSYYYPRYTRALRPFLLIFRRRNLRIIFASCLRACKKILIVLSLLACLIAFWGLMGYLLFSDYTVHQGRHILYFHTLGYSMYTMLLVHTSLPYMVEAMYPYFVLSEWTALFFSCFVLFTNFFFVKLIIAVSYKSYKNHTENMLFKRLQKRKVALFSAFNLLAQRNKIDITSSGSSGSGSIKKRGMLMRRGSSRWFGSTSPCKTPSNAGGKDAYLVSLDDWLCVCDYLRPDWSSTDAELVFNTVDLDHSGFVMIEDFYQLCSLSSVNVERPNRKLPPFCAKLRLWLRHLLHRGTVIAGYEVVYSEVIVGFLICLSVIQSVQVNSLKLAFTSHHIWRILGVVLLCLFTIEIVIKMFAYGTRGFMARPFCKLDVAIAIVGWIFYTSTSLAASPDEVSLVFYDLSLAVRVLRVIKLLNLIPPFRYILWTLKLILPLVYRMVVVIFVVVYAFAIFAQAIYGKYLLELTTSSQPIPAPAVKWFQYERQFQLDTFSHSLLTLFDVAILSGWIMIMNAVAAATSYATTTYFFFFIYRIILSNVLLPIFVGFVVESFVTHGKSVEMEMNVAVSNLTERMRKEKEEKKSKKKKKKIDSIPEVTALSADATAEEINAKADYYLNSEKKEKEKNIPPPSFIESARQNSKLFVFENNNSELLNADGDEEEDGKRYNLIRERKNSDVQGEMFDFSQSADARQMAAVIQAREEDIQEKTARIKKLETAFFTLQQRYQNSQNVILQYEQAMEQLSNDPNHIISPPCSSSRPSNNFNSFL